ncbi:MAG: FKBP-type peptidyl-prolyl cis-trans isomerase [bacterium]|nr:FKBP-type peptidyl-prolyl cis-trans isomerase [bacterium]
MNKNIFLYTTVVLLVGIATWFFINKMRTVSKEAVSLTPTFSNSVSDDSTKGGEWIKLPSGLEYQDVVMGQGTEAKNGDAVATHYLGTLQNGTKFDSSYDRGQPFVFLLGKGTVIKGWEEGLLGMKVGGKRKLIVPAHLGYGERGAGGGLIPPGATLLFDVELMAVETPE